MMRYPVLNKVADGVQYYLQKNHLLVRDADGSRMRSLSPGEVAETAAALFGLPRDLVDEALAALNFPAAR